MSATAKNLQRITESVEQHDAACKEKAKAVALCPFELDRLGFDHIMTKEGRKVPIVSDDTLGTGRLRVLCDGYHGPKREETVEDTVEAPEPSQRELVPAGAPEEGLTMVMGLRSGKTLSLERLNLAYEEHHPDHERISLNGVVMYRLRVRPC